MSQTEEYSPSENTLPWRALHQMTVVASDGGGDNDGCSGGGWWWWFHLIGQLVSAFRRLIGGGFYLFVNHCSLIGRQ